MKNRLLTLLPLLLMFFSFNASATIELACAVVGSVNANGEYIEEEYGTDGTLLLNANMHVEFVWEDLNPVTNSNITNVKFTYGSDYNLNEEYNSTDPFYFAWAGHNQSGTNSRVWLVPSNLAGEFIYITICDMFNTSNKSTIACQISGSAKTGDLSMKTFDINYYPNPVINELNITAGEVTINSVRLFDLKGNNLGNYEFNQSYQETIDVSALPSGTYVAIINEEEQVKIVKR